MSLLSVSLTRLTPVSSINNVRHLHLSTPLAKVQAGRYKVGVGTRLMTIITYFMTYIYVSRSH